MDLVLRKIIPKSKLALVLAGFLLAERLHVLSSISLLVFCLAVLLLMQRRKAVRLISNGMIIFFLAIFLKNYYPRKADIPIRPDRLPATEITLRPVTEIKSGYWRVKISAKDYTASGVVRFKNRLDENIPVLKCSPSGLKFIPAQQESFIEYGNIAIYPDMKQCHVVSVSRDHRRVFRKYIRSLLEQGGITDTPLAVSMGLIFGDTAYLSRSFKSRAREGGILHLFAASGLHIGILIATIFYILQFSKLTGYYITRLLPVTLCFAYLYMLNFPVSLVRAYSFAALIAVSSCFFRKINTADLMLYCAGLIYLVFPGEYLSLSFNLSFGAVAGILLLKPVIDQIIHIGKRKLLLENISLSLAASLGTFPLLLLYFKSYSYGSILINLVLIPLAGITLPVLYLSLLVEALHLLFVRDLFWTLTELLLRVLLFLADWLGKYIGFYEQTGDDIGRQLILYLILVISLYVVYLGKKFILKDKASKKVLLSSLISILGFLLFGAFYLGSYSMTPGNIRQENIAYNSTSYIILKGKTLLLGGNCKYYNFKMKQILGDYCKNKIETVWIGDENCLKLVFNCRHPSGLELLEYGDRRMQEWDNKYPVPFRYKSANHFQTIKDVSYVLFYPGKDSLEYLLQQTKRGKGKIILFFPFGSGDSSENWNKYRKYLGINPEWTFITANGKEISLL